MKLPDLKILKALSATDQAQLKVNAVEASGISLCFVSGWRPLCGWLSSLAVIGIPVLTWCFSVVLALMSVFGYIEPARVAEILAVLPEFSNGQLGTLLFSMLGMAGLRTLEKKQGTATMAIGNKLVEKLLGGKK